MNAMKKIAISFYLVIAILIVITGCSKKEDNNNPPVEKKKYAWVTGTQDSTGYGLILFSPDAGETWERQGQGQSALQGIDVQDIWAVDEDIVWAVGSKNTILRSQNGGVGWEKIQGPSHPAAPNLMSICIPDQNNIWISGSNGAVYNSTDGGNNWTMFDTNFFQSGGIQGIWAMNSQRIFAVGGVPPTADNERGIIVCTIDGGATWNTYVPSNDYNRNEWIGVVSNGATVVIYGGKSHYMVSMDEGETWRNDSVPGTGGGGGEADLNHLIMLGPEIWWGAYDMGQVGLTENWGSTWTIQSTGHGGDYLVGIDAWDSQLALVVGTSVSVPRDVPILKTSDGGTSWEVKKTVNTNLNKVSFIRNQ